MFTEEKLLNLCFDMRFTADVSFTNSAIREDFGWVHLQLFCKITMHSLSSLRE